MNTTSSGRKNPFSEERIRASIDLFISYMRNPIQGIRHLPDWSWPELIIHQLIITAATGALAGFVQSSFLSTLHGLVIIPLITAVLISVSGLFFYFFFQIFAGRTLSLRKIMTLIFFANVPYFIFQTISFWFPPVSLIGLAFTGLILITGLVDGFDLPRRLVARTVISLYLLFMLVWLLSRIDAINFERSMDNELKAPPVELGQ